MRLAHLALVTAALCVPPPAALAQTPPAARSESQVKAGVDAWGAGQFEAAVRTWQGPAAKGDADAQFNLAQAYRMGKGVPADLAKAEALYGRAAQQGHLQAGDNLGLLLFQSGRRAEAMPFITRSAERGDPRAQYVLGIAAFNGDGTGRDWVRAYALMTRASSAGLPQARNAIASMDQIIPLKERQLGVSLASELERQAQSAQHRAVAAADLGTMAPEGARPAPETPTAGADYAHPAALAARTAAAPARPAGAATAERPAPPPIAHKAPATSRPPEARTPTTGRWRVQFGAFGNKTNADQLWVRLARHPELSGKSRFDVRAGAVSRLQAGPFASEAEARRACAALAPISGACVVVRN
jgi:cell division protein FtsN